jgi:hypothetical protein
MLLRSVLVQGKCKLFKFYHKPSCFMFLKYANFSNPIPTATTYDLETKDVIVPQVAMQNKFGKKMWQVVTTWVAVGLGFKYSRNVHVATLLFSLITT